MTDEEHVERRLLLSVDARGYGSAPGWMHGGIQHDLLQVLDTAAREAGLHREMWDRQGAGDGELSVLPPEEPEVRVVGRFPRELADALFRLNRGRSEAARLRLRLAVHFGSAKPGPNGYRYAGPVVVSRLCDSEPLRRTLALSGADLAVAYSRQIYTDTIRSGLTLLDPARLRRVRAVNKEFDEDAWIWVPGWRPEDYPEAQDDTDESVTEDVVTEDSATEDSVTEDVVTAEVATGEGALAPAPGPVRRSSTRPEDRAQRGTVVHDVYGGSTVPASFRPDEPPASDDG